MSSARPRSSIWHKGVITATIGWVVVFLGVTILPPSLFAILSLGTWILLPVAIYKDSATIRESVAWPKHRWVYLLTSLVWFVAVVPGLIYLWKRHTLTQTEEASQLTPAVKRVDDTAAETNESADIDEMEIEVSVESDLDHDDGQGSVDDESDDYEFSRSTIDYHGHQYWCTTVLSSNGDWCGAYGRDLSEDSSRFFLHHNEDLQFSIEIETGQGCAVADTGTAAVLDGLERTELSGKLTVFDSSGDRRFSHLFNSNLGAGAISDDGAYVAVATFNPDCRTYIFDVESGSQMVEHEHLDGNKHKLEFNDKNGELQLSLFNSNQGGPYYTIDLDGEIVWRSDELRREERLEELLNRGGTDNLREAIDHLDEAYELADDENERKRVARKLADAHWQLSKEIKREEGDTDAWWEHLNQAKTYYTEILPWYDGKQGVAKVARKQGRYHLKQGNDDTALELFRTIAELEAEYDVQLLTDADERRIEELSTEED